MPDAFHKTHKIDFISKIGFVRLSLVIKVMLVCVNRLMSLHVAQPKSVDAHLKLDLASQY